MFVALLLETSKRLDLNTYLNLLKNSGEWTRLTLPYNHSRRDYGFAGYGLKSEPETYMNIWTGQTKFNSSTISYSHLNKKSGSPTIPRRSINRNILRYISICIIFSATSITIIACANS